MPPRLSVIAAAVLAFALTGCASWSWHNEPPLAVVHFPVSYQVPLGGPAVPHVGNPRLDITATQDVAVSPSKPLYIAIESPVSLTVYIYERVGAAPNANLLATVDVPARQVVKKRLIPPTSSLEFLFASPGSDVAGTLQFTLSDEPLAGGRMQPPATFIGQ